MLTGTKLLEEVFSEEVLENLPDLREIEEVDGVTNWSIDFSYNSGWYNYYTVSFNYNGKKYEFEYQDHTSDNVCDSEVDVASFKECEEAVERTVTEGNHY
ncbi:hypothetical protein V7094_27890, partial [Priestia megaterium]|uniref:hypothetical protein n=1 Tax=Priestia megaterium TaxID=1404 RepID=UPI002FFD6C6D